MDIVTICGLKKYFGAGRRLVKALDDSFPDRAFFAGLTDFLERSDRLVSPHALRRPAEACGNRQSLDHKAGAHSG